MKRVCSIGMILGTLFTIEPPYYGHFEEHDNHKIQIPIPIRTANLMATL